MKVDKSFFHGLIFLIFIYSGMLKWLPWPIDPTLLFAIFLGISSLFYIRPLSRAESKVFKALLIFLLFAGWMLFGVTYTSSQIFVWKKVQGFVLAIIAFVIPIFTMTKERYLYSLRQAFNVLWTVAVIGLMIAFVQNDLVYVRGLMGADNNTYPDYLVVGEFLGMGILLNLNNDKKYIMVLKALSLFMMIYTGGRGPMLFLVPVYLLYGYYRYNFKTIKFSRLLAMGVVLGGLVYVLFFSGLGAETVSRFTKATESSVTDKSLVDRFIAWNLAIEMFQREPIKGVGFGAYGLEGYGTDKNEYPHNMLLEAAAEGGIIGLILVCCLLIIMFRPRWHWIKNQHLGTLFFLVGLFFLMQYFKANGLIDSRRIFWVFGVILAYERAILWNTSREPTEPAQGDLQISTL